MIKEFKLSVSPEAYYDSSLLKTTLAKKLTLHVEDITEYTIERRSIDARAKEPLFQILGKVYLGEKALNNFFPNPFTSPQTISTINANNKKEVFIIGAGPAGLFAALRLIQFGIKPIILERGKDVRERRRDLAILNRTGILNPESNYCFGEGGAGTYSDGKLYTRSDKRGSIDTILQWLIYFGADKDILVDTRPHIGTNRLPEIIINIRKKIEDLGGEIYFGQKLTSIHHSFGRMVEITTNHSQKWSVNQLILATGHSAKDIYYLLHAANILVQAKPFALGLRIEHPQTLIDQIQYHQPFRNPFLPPAYYSLKEQIDGQGVFSFCMCPGGIIAPSSTEQDSVVVNGWSPSKRNNPYSNSGIVVQVELENLMKGSNSLDPFYALDFQSSIEHLASQQGGGGQKAPAQRLVDFVDGRLSNDLPKCSYIPGVNLANFKEILPPWILNRLKKAFPKFGQKMKGYFTNEALVVGVESRTSSPIRIPRNSDDFQHPMVKGLYPCGEGAGYAGGILSAAMDGYKIAEAIGKE